MSAFVQNIAIDCADPYQLAQFWSQVVDRPISDEDSPGDPEASISLGNGVDLVFLQVPEAKAVKNRLHVCLRPQDRTREEEVRRLLDLGATMVADHREPGATCMGWAVLADPAGNEFCVLCSPAERAAG
ncbi:VOC family protein [Amycolatopsis aidingensis]|uniref:VOC family protein n=1 Tax=Amycolatopsis aidingensis TaxID=2842453 RepID=UPI001C0D8621|nr:VOC family protein [Amycolatopsis aidingensis]